MYSWRLFSFAAAAAFLAACAGAVTPSAIPPAGRSAGAGIRPESVRDNVARFACAYPAAGDTVRCFGWYRTDVTAATAPGYGPPQLHSAYNLPSAGGNGQTVAIVDAYDDPHAGSDLAAYRSYFELPPCTSSNGCFRKVNQKGGHTYPKANAGWAQEISLDLDMVSAICANCHILLVEANSAGDANLAVAENTAAALGATEISNSYGGAEANASNAAYDHPGIVITASAGDRGYGAQQPCTYATVVCVGGTTLATATNTRGYSETVWPRSGSGCSAYVAKPAWQNDTGCTMRSESDVSFDADPHTGVPIYDTYGTSSTWLQAGGTSVGSPAIAAIFALAGNAASSNAAQQLWAAKGTGLYSIVSGSNGTCPAAYPYICTAGTGADGVYSGPSGWGTPDGVTAF